MLLQSRIPLLQRGDFGKERAIIGLLYRQHAYSPIWMSASGLLTGQALSLMQAMDSAGDFGLNPSSYEALKLREAATAAKDDPSRAQVDLAISISALRFATHLHFGRVDPKAVDFHMPARSSIDFVQVLSRLATEADATAALSSLEPQFQHYRTLKSALATYRKLENQPRKNLPPLRSKSIRPSETYAGAAQLRGLLAELGDLPAASDNAATECSTLDAEIVEGLKRFQFRHGLRQDGVLGRETYAQLVAPLHRRVRQIELTLERWRWLPVADAPTIIVNIPQFRLFAFPRSDDREDQMITMDVIVGTFPRTRTPVFAADLKYVKFRPYWDVPYSIMKGELLPQLRGNPAYLKQHDMEIVASQSDQATPLAPSMEVLERLAAGKLRLRQRPGADNPLGLVKFMLPNPYNVYLHSTPNRGLFSESNRTFSHGCIRVSDPVGLAAYVLRHAEGNWTRENIEAAMQGADNQRVDLQQWIRVLILYGTAVATEAGKVYFFDDVYGNDARLEKLLGQ